jgi:RimJ/RimL family protein N-acetyltransferase
MTDMKKGLYLRPATLEDAKTLFEWRNDPQVRAASHDQNKICFEDHLAWLENSLANPDRELYIAEEDGVSVGTVRLDWVDNAYTLSWTVRPEARGKGVGKRMVSLLVKQIREPIRAEVKVGNLASMKISQGVGMQLDFIKNGILYFSRKALR